MGVDEVSIVGSSTIPSLKRIEIQESNIELGNVVHTTQLQELLIQESKEMFDILDSLCTFSMLRYLTIQETKVDMKDLGCFPYLKKLHIDKLCCNVKDFLLRNPQVIDIQITLNSDVKMLQDIVANAPHLKSLEVINCGDRFQNELPLNFSDTQISRLRLVGCRLAPLYEITKADKLQRVELVQCGITDFDILGKLPELRMLDLSKNEIKDIKCLHDFTEFVNFRFMQNPFLKRSSYPKDLLGDWHPKDFWLQNKKRSKLWTILHHKIMVKAAFAS
jgi:Leucine-rich repeat (LRR) protein